MFDALGAKYVITGLDVMQAQGKLTEDEVRTIVQFVAQTLLKHIEEAEGKDKAEGYLAATAERQGMSVEKVKEAFGLITPNTN